ncbi:MAG TPA: metallophosphoesterase family protein [Opitutaceae bacterium]|nr:metallophosphoesterase family protein [Opitutaceae bacterium]
MLSLPFPKIVFRSSAAPRVIARCAGALALGALLAAAPVHAASELKCTADGTFRVLLVSDTHFTPVRDEHGIALLERLIDTEHPDLVVVNGDCITGNPGPRVEDMKQAVANVAFVMEEKKVPWAVTIGNHDGEQLSHYGITKADMLGFYERYPHNLNAGWNRAIHGAGNKYFLIYDSQGTHPIFCLWLIDSNAYFPDDPSMPNKAKEYDWIHTDEIAWYFQTSKDLEAKYGHKIPGLMFFHIPLPEFHEMVMTKKTIGERHEPESTPKINSGMFAAVFERGDVKGIFCGHDHVNNYLGYWRGVMLGYDGVAGYMPYPHIPDDDAANGQARDGRVFLLDQAHPGQFKTWIRFSDGSTNWESSSESYLKQGLK